MISQDPNISAIILAAGKAARMDKIKQLLPFRDGTVLGRVVQNALDSSLHEAIVVLGHAAEEIRRVIDFGHARIVINADYCEGQSTSLRTGLAAISADSDAAVFILGDQPLVGPDVIDALVKCYRQQSAPFIVPTYQGKRGNPVLIARAVFHRLESLEGDVGARILFDEYADRLCEIEMGDKSIAFDVDTLDDYALLQGMEKDVIG